MEMPRNSELFRTELSVEWRTDLPPNDIRQTRYSPTFKLLDRECKFQWRPYYATLKDLSYHLLLHITESISFELEFSIDFIGLLTKREPVTIVHSFPKGLSSDYPTIWVVSQKALASNLGGPEFLLGCIVKFSFIFRRYEEINLQANSLPSVSDKTDDKSVQTSDVIRPKLQCLESLSDDFSKLLAVGGAQHDVVLKCGGRIIEAHKAVLGARSSVLAAKLKRDDVAEGGASSCVEEFPDVDEALLPEFVRYLYSGTLPELSWDVAKNLHAVGEQYAVESLKKLCAIFLFENLTPENACEFLIWAEAHGDPVLKQSAISYVLDHKIPLLSDQWPNFALVHPALANEVLFAFYRLQTQA